MQIARRLEPQCGVCCIVHARLALVPSSKFDTGCIVSKPSSAWEHGSGKLVYLDGFLCDRQEGKDEVYRVRHLLD